MPRLRIRIAVPAAALALSLLAVCGMASWERAAASRPAAQQPRRYAFIEDQIRTTSPAIALGNLEAQIQQLDQQSQHGALTVGQRAGLAELLLAHGQYTGSIADRERALDIAETMARAVPDDPQALLARARARSAFHRFAEALADLDRAAALGGSPIALADQRAAIYQALGRSDEALGMRRSRAERNPNSDTLGALAAIEAERGATDEAARLFDEARWRYRDVSPFPLAFLYFDEGAMWMRHGDLERARALFAAALRRVPSYAAARCRLAEVEAALGHRDDAIALLEPLARSADDPDAAAQLARILTDAGRADEALPWRQVAVRRYDELTAAYPDAYGPHAAELRLDPVGPQPSAAAQRYAPAPRRLASVSW
ncbi:MAG: tetratricopeptide repeat protein [bacterium]